MNDKVFVLRVGERRNKCLAMECFTTRLKAEAAVEKLFLSFGNITLPIWYQIIETSLK
jgi:hypothetical protein